jgi:hypothetical protein
MEVLCELRPLVPAGDELLCRDLLNLYDCVAAWRTKKILDPPSVSLARFGMPRSDGPLTLAKDGDRGVKSNNGSRAVHEV